MFVEYDTAQLDFEPAKGFTSICPTAENVDLAQTISDWTTTAGNMLPKNPDQILALFEKGHSIVVVNNRLEPVSHAAATYVYSDGSIELGAVYTAEEHRGKGTGTTAVLEALNMLRAKYNGNKIFALANPMSTSMFEKMGGRKMLPTEVTSEAWVPCDTCPSKRDNTITVFHCCNTPYELTDIGLMLPKSPAETSSLWLPAAS